MRLRTLFLLAITTLLLSACNFSLAADITPPPNYVPPTPAPTMGPLFPPQAPNVQNGQSIFAEKCVPCHGQTGLGDGPQGKQLPVPVAALGLADTARKASPARWFTVVTQGNIERYMPPFSSLTEQERWDVIHYALSLHMTPDMVQRGKVLFDSKCTGCPTAPFTGQEKMAALSEDDLARMIREGGDGLPPFGAELSDEEVYAVAAYLRTLTFASPEAAATQVVATQSAGTAVGTAAAGETPAAEGTPAAGAAPSEGTAQAEVTGQPAAVSGTGTVSGTVSNKSGAGVPEGTAITLRGYDHAQDSSGPQETMTLDGTLGADGSYSFPNVDLPDGRILLAEVEYQGITYQSPFKTPEAGQTNVTLDPITVYESSEDFSQLNLDQLHLAFDFGTGETMQVFEIYSFTNSSNQAILIKTDGTQVPFINVPEGAQDVGFEAGQDTAPFAPAKDGIAILPSESPYSLIAFFSLPYDSTGTSLTQPLLLKTDSISVFMPEGLKVKSSDLADAGVQNISGSNFHMYSAKDRPANSVLSFTVSGKPDLTPSNPQPTNRNALIYGAGALGLALIGLGAWMYLRDRNQRGEAQADEEVDQEFEDTESVLDAIIALDDLHRAKKIPDEAYQLRRAELKEQLKRLESQ